MSDEKASPIACLAFNAAHGSISKGLEFNEDQDSAVAEAIGAAFDAIVRDALEQWPHTAPEDLLRGWLGEGVPSQPAGTIRRREFTDGSNPFYTAAAEIQQCEYPDHPEFCTKAEKIIRALFERLTEATHNQKDYVEAIEELRSPEGSSVLILCDNEEGNPNNAIEVVGPYTGWEPKRYGGGSVVDALFRAVAQKRDWDQRKAAPLEE